MINRTPLSDHPHFKDIPKGRQPQRYGTWNYQKESSTAREVIERQLPDSTCVCRDNRHQLNRSNT